jgi:hypothetical protein
LNRYGLATCWHDGNIDPGREWEKEVLQHLNTADVILLLISPDFMASDYCYSKEMKRAMERQRPRLCCGAEQRRFDRTERSLLSVTGSLAAPIL